jgi:glycosyltransferase involved in cell wall biosynthesis
MTPANTTAASAAMTPTPTPPARSTPRRLQVIYPYPCVGHGISSVALELCDAIARHPELRRCFEVTHWVSYATPECERPGMRTATLPLLARLAMHFRGGSDRLGRRIVRKMIAACRPGDLALVYPGFTPAESDALRRRGARLVHDPVNTAFPSYWRALRAAYTAAEMPPPGDRVVHDTITEERQRIHPGDLAFVCSPQVMASYEEFGLPRTHLVPTSNGWSPDRFRPVHRSRRDCRFLFVGSGCVRKGLPVLLRAWARADVAGRLMIVGDLDAEVAEHCAPLLRHPTVDVRPFTKDLASLYAEASVFVLPSFEEGSPLVSYLALAAGVPSLLSPAAAGWVVRDGIEGDVVDPADVDALAVALQRLASDRDRCERMGAAARLRATDYTWDRVAVARFQALDRLLLQPPGR